MEHLAGLFERRLFVFLVFAVGMTAAAVRGIADLGFNDVPREVFVSDDETFTRLLELQRDFGSDDNDVLLVLESEDWFTPRATRELRRWAAELAASTGVEVVHSLAEIPDFGGGLLPRPLLPGADAPPERFESARRRARDHPLVPGRLLSEDGRTTLVLVRLAGEALGIQEVTSRLEAIRAVMEAGAERWPELRARWTGVPVIRVEIYHSIRREQVLFTSLGALVCAVLGWWLFKSLRAVVAVTLPPACGALWALGAVGLAGREIDILGTVLPTLVIVIGFTDCVHLMIDVRISLARGRTPREAAADAIRHVGLPCALTSLTTAIGFSSLAFADIPAIRAFGELAALAVAVAFLAVLTSFPLLVVALRDVGTSEEGDLAPGTTRAGGGLVRLATRLIDGVLARPRAVSAAGIAASVVLLWLGSRLEPENRLTESLPRGEAYAALRDCEEAFGGILPAYVVCSWGPELGLGAPEVRSALDEVEALFEACEIGRPTSILGVLRATPFGEADPEKALPLLPADLVSGLVRTDLRKALVSAPVPDAGRERMEGIFAAIQAGLARIEARHPEVSLYLSGTDFVARSNINRMIAGLARSLGLAAVLIFLVIALEFRSLRLGLVSLLPNLFPLVVVAGLLALVGLPLQMGSAVLFTVLLGLAVDDTIHFLARLRRERDAGLETVPALRAAFLTVGKAICITTVILVVGFGVVVFSEVPTNRLFAGLIGVGLLAALVGDLVLLPALLALRTK